MPETRLASPVEAWRGAGWFNVYFLAKFALAYFGYLTLDPALNALLFAVVLFPIGTKWLEALRDTAAAVAAFALLWSESWLPGPETIRQNTANLQDFSSDFLLDFLQTAVNPTMAAWFVVGLVAWLFLRHWIRFSTLTAIGLVVAACPQVVTWVMPTDVTPTVETATGGTAAAGAATVRAEEEKLLPVQPAAGKADDIDGWLQTFFDYEAKRRISLPNGMMAASETGAFDIAIVNICSLSADDLQATGLADHPVWSRFDVHFDRFSSVTSYSGPASLRLLTSACGQPSHADLYTGRRPECELLNRLGDAGWENRLYMDHNGAFDNYLQTLRDRAGLKPALNDLDRAKPLYYDFDGSHIHSSYDVFSQWFEALPPEPSRTVSFFNLVALHDGNRSLRDNSQIDFASRAKRLLDDLERIMARIEESRRPVLFLIVPEHGAAVRGDKIQMARLREIPSPHITNVPIYVKFFGLEGLTTQKGPKTMSDPVSYLAVSELVSRTITSGLYRQDAASQGPVLQSILTDLPQTWPVSQNANASVVRFAGSWWIRLRGGKWLHYPQ